MWTVLTTELFEQWLWKQDVAIRNKTLATLSLLQKSGPVLGRPLVDSVKGSAFINMKELRIQVSGVPWRAFFAFDPLRRAVILTAGCKKGDEKRFYSRMVRIADGQFQLHLNSMEGQQDGQNTE